MAGLCWVAVVLTFSLSTGDSLAAVDQNWLASVIEGIKNEYKLGDTFSVAVNVPQNQDPNNLQQVLQEDPPDKVKQTVSEGQVYIGTRVVAAAQPEAVSRVLENIQPLVKSSQGHFLVIYSEESPCGPTCADANQNGMAGNINSVIHNWSGYAFVFSKVVDVPDADTSRLSESFKQLGISKLGLDNVFRCYKPGDDPFQCTTCSSGGDVTPSCVANNAPENQDQDVGQEVDQKVGQDVGQEVGQGVGQEVGTVPGIGQIVPNIGKDIATDIGGGTGGGMGEGKGEWLSKCKGGGGRKGGCKRRGGGKRRKGGKVRKGHKQRGGKGKRKGKARGGGRGKRRRGGKRRGGGGKSRKGGKRRGRRRG